jgi:hypothetical protein
MVDPTKGIGQVQSLAQASKARQASHEREEKKPERADRTPRDEVKISQEALSLKQAEQAASNVRADLERNRDVTLGLDPAIVDQSA